MTLFRLTSTMFTGFDRVISGTVLAFYLDSIGRGDEIHHAVILDGHCVYTRI